MELKRQGLAGAELRTRRRGLKLSATTHGRAAGHCTRAGQSRNGIFERKEIKFLKMLCAQSDSHWRFLLACPFSKLLALCSIIIITYKLTIWPWQRALWIIFLKKNSFSKRVLRTACHLDSIPGASFAAPELKLLPLPLHTLSSCYTTLCKWSTMLSTLKT